MATKMPSENSPALLVARFLKANHYQKTLQTFLEESGLSDEAANIKPGDWTMEKLVNEKTQFDTSLAYEKATGQQSDQWRHPAPSKACEVNVETSSNILCVVGSNRDNTLSISSADRVVKTVQAGSDEELVVADEFQTDGPILSLCNVSETLQLATSMSGKLILHDRKSYTNLDERRDHSKYAVQVISHAEQGLWMIATAAWDQKLIFYSPDPRVLDDPRSVLASSERSGINRTNVLGEPVHIETLPSNPESMVFVRNPDTQDIYLVATRRDSSFLYYFRLTKTSRSGERPTVTVAAAGRQNLAPHSNAWVAFTPCNLAICPVDPSLVAVATSHLPHLKIIVVRLLFPDTKLGQGAPETIAALARADLALQDREDAAISLHVSTMAPQTPYSTPQVVWRPDGSGLWVNGDDGVIRGVETKSGKVIAHLQAHEAGSKVRTLWAGKLRYISADEREVLVSGGFDKKVFIWCVNSGPNA